ncbi:MAG: hypothetical protein ABI597_09485 [Gammaproteobacteria bacterium]
MQPRESYIADVAKKNTKYGVSVIEYLVSKPELSKDPEKTSLEHRLAETDAEGNTALHWAFYHANTQSVNYLITQGAPQHIKTKPVDAKDENSNTGNNTFFEQGLEGFIDSGRIVPSIRHRQFLVNVFLNGYLIPKIFQNKKRYAQVFTAMGNAVLFDTSDGYQFNDNTKLVADFSKTSVPEAIYTYFKTQNETIQLGNHKIAAYLGSYFSAMAVEERIAKTKNYSEATYWLLRAKSLTVDPIEIENVNNRLKKYVDQEPAALFDLYVSVCKKPEGRLTREFKELDLKVKKLIKANPAYQAYLDGIEIFYGLMPVKYKIVAYKKFMTAAAADLEVGKYEYMAACCIEELASEKSAQEIDEITGKRHISDYLFMAYQKASMQDDYCTMRLVLAKLETLSKSEKYSNDPALLSVLAQCYTTEYKRPNSSIEWVVHYQQNALNTYRRVEAIDPSSPNFSADVIKNSVIYLTRVEPKELADPYIREYAREAMELASVCKSPDLIKTYNHVLFLAAKQFETSGLNTAIIYAKSAASRGHLPSKLFAAKYELVQRDKIKQYAEIAKQQEDLDAASQAQIQLQEIAKIGENFRVNVEAALKGHAEAKAEDFVQLCAKYTTVTAAEKEQIRDGIIISKRFATSEHDRALLLKEFFQILKEGKDENAVKGACQLITTFIWSRERLKEMQQLITGSFLDLEVVRDRMSGKFRFLFSAVRKLGETNGTAALELASLCELNLKYQRQQKSEDMLAQISRGEDHLIAALKVALLNGTQEEASEARLKLLSLTAGINPAIAAEKIPAINELLAVGELASAKRNFKLPEGRGAAYREMERIGNESESKSVQIDAKLELARIDYERAAPRMLDMFRQAAKGNVKRYVDLAVDGNDLARTTLTDIHKNLSSQNPNSPILKTWQKDVTDRLNAADEARKPRSQAPSMRLSSEDEDSL